MGTCLLRMSASQPAAKHSYQPPTPISELCTFIERHRSHTSLSAHSATWSPLALATHIGRRPTRWPGSTGGTSSCHHSTRTCSHRFARPWPARADGRARCGAARGGMARSASGPPLPRPHRRAAPPLPSAPHPRASPRLISRHTAAPAVPSAGRRGASSRGRERSCSLPFNYLCSRLTLHLPGALYLSLSRGA